MDSVEKVGVAVGSLLSGLVASSPSRGRRDELGELAEVLDHCREMEFVSGAVRTSEAKAIVARLRQVEVLQLQGMAAADAIRQVGVSEVTYCRWCKAYGGMGADQLKRLAAMAIAGLPPCSARRAGT